MTSNHLPAWNRLGRRWAIAPVVALALMAACCMVVAAQPVAPGAARALPDTALAAPGATVAATRAFTVALGADVEGLDPALTTDSNTLLVTSQIFETLVTFRRADMAPAPGLAESWTVSEDHLTWTFNLRPDARFHDGTAVDAEAVVYNIERWWDPAHPAHSGSFDYFAVLFGGFKGDPASLIADIGALNETQVRITLRQPANQLPSLLGMAALAIASPQAIQAGTLTTRPVGSGPFRFIERKPGEIIRLEANPAASPRQPWLETLAFRIIPDGGKRLASLQSGAVLSCGDLDTDALAAVGADPGLEVHWRSAVNVGYLGMTRSHPPLDDVRVRQAIAHAINRQHLVDAAYPAGSQVAKTLLPPAIWGNDPGIQDYSYDPALARALLAQAGHAGGITLPLSIRAVPRPYLPDPAAIAHAVQADLAEVGITAPIITYTTGDFLTRVWSGSMDLFLLGWNVDYPHPADFLTAITCDGKQTFGPPDDELCEHLKSAAEAPDFAAELAIYRWASVRVHDTLPMLPLSYGRASYLAMRRPTAGLFPSPLGIEDYSTVFFASAWTYMPVVAR